MKLSYSLKTDTVFSLIVTGCELKACVKTIAELINSKTYSIDNRDVELEIYTGSIDARNGLNEEYENYFLQVLQVYRNI